MIVLFITALQTEESLQNGISCLCFWRETQRHFVVFEPFNLCGKYKDRRFILGTEKNTVHVCNLPLLHIDPEGSWHRLLSISHVNLFLLRLKT